MLRNLYLSFRWWAEKSHDFVRFFMKTTLFVVWMVHWLWEPAGASFRGCPHTPWCRDFPVCSHSQNHFLHFYSVSCPFSFFLVCPQVVAPLMKMFKNFSRLYLSNSSLQINNRSVQFKGWSLVSLHVFLLLIVYSYAAPLKTFLFQISWNCNSQEK